MQDANGNEFISLDEACEILDLSDIVVGKMGRDGLIRRKKFKPDGGGNKQYYYLLDGVIAQKEVRESKFAYGDLFFSYKEDLRILNVMNPYSFNRRRFIPSQKYAVTNTGRVINLSQNKELKQTLNADGYLTVPISCNGEQQTIQVNQLVGALFCPNRRHKSQTHHKNGIRTDNRKENILCVDDPEQKELHGIINHEGYESFLYIDRMAEIEKDNQYTDEEEDSIVILEEKDDDFIYLLRLTKEGFEKYVKTGTVKGEGIITEYAMLRKKK